MSVGVGGRVKDLVLGCFQVVFECESVFVSVCIVLEVMFGVEVASGDVHVVTGFVCDLVWFFRGVV